jgi:hypothetical protein
MEDLKTILESRGALYAKADAEVTTSGKNAGQALSALLAVIERRKAAAD